MPEDKFDNDRKEIKDSLREISVRLAHLEQEVAGFKSLLGEQMKQASELVHRHNTILFDPVNGLAIRVDRLDQIEIYRRWGIRALWGVVTAVITTIIVNYIK
jgi:hypothetical protein